MTGTMWMMSAQAPARRRMPLPLPPSMRGGPGFWTGFGVHTASVTWKYRPAKVNGSSRQSPRMTVTASSMMRSRSDTSGNSIPIIANSARVQPAPTPAITRPPLASSS